MGFDTKNNIELVISHYEGSGGNFLGRLYAGKNLDSQPDFRVDTNRDPYSIPINGRDNWYAELEKDLKDHTVLITHNFDLKLIADTFPDAKLIQLYPYSQIGNILYNISHKKLSMSMDNAVDNHYIHIQDWYAHCVQHRPDYTCTDPADLSNKPFIEQLLGVQFTVEQDRYFNKYWSNQLKYNLVIPNTPLSMCELVNLWAINDWCTDWSMAFLLFVYELTHGLIDQRKWSIDQQVYNDWDSIYLLENQYNFIG
tara:strand:- start:18 stop:779 length:762 start_codon:yes stop_codon:yes gene_type:complete